MKIVGFLLLLTLIVPCYGHENHNEIFSPDENTWTWDTSLSVGKSFTWDLEVWDYGSMINKGQINIIVNSQLSQVNLLDYFDNNKTTFNEYSNNFFDISFSEDIRYYSSVYFAKHFLAPVIFANSTGVITNILEDSSYGETLYIGLINETIDLTCIQGCHIESTSPFSTNDAHSYISQNEYVIEGNFSLNDFPSAYLYGYEGGYFKAIYSLEGVLEKWVWESSDSLEKVLISKTSISNTQWRLVFYFIGIPVFLLIIAIFYAKRRLLPKIV